MPTLHRYNASVPTQGDYIATYDSSTSRITRLTVDGLDDPRGLSLHGMDVVPDARDPRTLWMYVVNHRAPVSTTGRRSDPAIEVFRTDVGARKISHVQTYTGPEVLSPNDIVGASDGKSFWFTNDGTHHQGLAVRAFVSSIYVGFSADGLVDNTSMSTRFTLAASAARLGFALRAEGARLRPTTFQARTASRDRARTSSSCRACTAENSVYSSAKQMSRWRLLTLLSSVSRLLSRTPFACLKSDHWV